MKKGTIILKATRLILVVSLITTMLPWFSVGTVSAEEITPLENGLTIKAYGSSVINAGIEEAENPEGIDVTAVLTDKKHWGIGAMLSCRYRSSENGNRDKSIAHDHNKEFTLKFVYNDDDETERILEFSWEGEQPVRRLDLWYGERDDIGNYEIQVPDGNGGWQVHSTGNLDNDEVTVTMDTPQEGTSTYYPVLFEPISTTSLRFVFKMTRSVGPSFTEVRLATTNDYNLLQTGTDAAIFDDIYRYQAGTIYHTGVVAKNCLYSKATYYEGQEGVNQAYGVFDDWGQEMGFAWPASLWNRTNNYYIERDDDGDCYYAVNMHFYEHRQFVNRINLSLNRGTADGFEVYTTNDVDNYHTMRSDYQDPVTGGNVLAGPHDFSAWTKVGAFLGTVTDADEIKLDLPQAEAARFWLIRMVNPSEDIQLKPVGMYVIDESEFQDLTRDAIGVFDAVDSGVIVAGDMNFPSQVYVGSNLYNVLWDCDSDLVDVSTGAVTHPQVDTEVTVTAIVSPADEPNNKIQSQHTFTIAAFDERERVSLQNEEFLGTVAETFEESTGAVSISDGQAVIGNGQAVYDLSLPYGFECKIKNSIDIDLVAGSTGTITVNGKDGKILDLLLTPADVTVIGNTVNSSFDATGLCDIKLDFDGNLFNVSFDNGLGQVMKLYKEDVITKNTYITDITFKGTNSGNLTVKSLDNSVVSEELLDMVKNQLSAKNFSETPSAALSKPLNLMDKVGNVVFTYASSNETVVNSTTGAVKLEERIPVTFTVTGTSTSGTFSTPFVLVPAKNNLFAGCEISGIGSDVDNLTDNDISTAWTIDSSAGVWRVSADLGEEKYFNELLIAFDDAQQTGIKSFILSTSENGRTFTDFYEADVTDSVMVLDTGLVKTRHLRVTAQPSGRGTSGMLEFAGYLELDDAKKCEYDFEVATKDFNPETTKKLAKTGIFGSNVEITSDSKYIEIGEDGEYWTITIDEPNEEEAVNVLMTVTNGETVKTKNYRVVLLGNSDLKGNRPSGGGGGKGGYSSSGSYVPGIIVTEQNNAVVPVNKIEQELKGHWGETEIRYLMEKNVVKGDGESLNLSGNVKRGEFLKMMLSAFGYEPTKYSGSFADVSSENWYADYAETAKINGIMAGDGVYFRGDDNISRQEMAVVLMNLLKQKGVIIENTSETVFTDSDSIANWANDSVKGAVSLGLIKGYENGEFMPKKELRRDEAMVVVYRAIASMNADSQEVVE